MFGRWQLTYRSKGKIAEIFYLVFISVLSPMAVGFQIFNNPSFIGSLILLNILNVPAIILFYRGYLPFTVGKGKYLLAVITFPIYILAYELNVRLSSVALIHLPFIPSGYKENLASSSPQDFSEGYFVQTFGYTSLVLLAATSLYVSKLLLHHQEKTYQLENENLKLELNHLKSQLHPHFFFNTLNNLYSLAVQGSSTTPKVIKDLSTIMRYVLYETSHGKVTLQQEIDFIKSYIHLENIRHSQESLIEFSIQGDINGVEIEPLLILPLIENTFKHSVRKEITTKWVKAVLVVDGDEIIFQTSNPISQLNEIDRTEQQGIGLTNLRKRLQLLYPLEHELLVEEVDEVFVATLTVKQKG